MREAAVNALIVWCAAIPEDTIQRRLNHVPEWMRSEVVSELGKLGAQALLVRIVLGVEPSTPQERTLGAPDDRMAATSALGDIGEAAPGEPLLQTLRDDEFWVRGAAMLALGRL